MTSGPIAERIFTTQDQEWFAAFSGDRNPMHMDEVAARRTQAGTCAVHGVHAFLWALEVLAAEVPLGRLATARVDFSRFIALGGTVTLDLRAATAERVEAELVQGGRRVVGIELGFAAAEPVDAAQPPLGTLPAVPDEPSLEALKAASGAFGPPEAAAGLAAQLFPRVTEALGTGRTVSIGLLSALVGMVAPGLHSIFSNIRLGFGPAAEAGGWLGYRVALLDERFRMATIKVEGVGLAGTVGAFVRFAPVRSPSLPDLEKLVARTEFADRAALVVGGSRGLGACAAKLIAAGGGSVTLTYLNGVAEAEAIQAEIDARYGAGRCRIARYDAAADPLEQLGDLPGGFTHLYYFATGRIADQAEGMFDRARFDGFVDVYVAAFAALVRALLDREPVAPLTVLYPSSVFVAARPRGMTEYAMAKAAGELLCAELMRGNRRLTVTAPRLPRVLTDQTATVPPVPVEDPVEVLLPLLRAENPGR